jgi:hypothetical protein
MDRGAGETVAHITQHILTRQGRVRVVAQFGGQIHHTGVILKDFSPEEPALSEVEGISRVLPQSP